MIPILIQMMTAASLEVSQIAVSGGDNSAVNSGSTYNSGTPTTVTGTYGQLTIGADGTYTYVANQSAADDLDAGDTATDTFTYTVTDGQQADTATADIAITVTGVNDVPTASDNTVTTTKTRLMYLVHLILVTLMQMMMMH